MDKQQNPTTTETSEEAPRLAGAYVQAWVWVCLGPDQQDLTEDQIRTLARARWHRDGACEIDPDAVVSLSEE